MRGRRSGFVGGGRWVLSGQGDASVKGQHQALSTESCGGAWSVNARPVNARCTGCIEEVKGGACAEQVWSAEQLERYPRGLAPGVSGSRKGQVRFGAPPPASQPARRQSGESLSVLERSGGRPVTLSAVGPSRPQTAAFGRGRASAHHAPTTTGLCRYAVATPSLRVATSCR